MGLDGSGIPHLACCNILQHRQPSQSKRTLAAWNEGLIEVNWVGKRAVRGHHRTHKNRAALRSMKESLRSLAQDQI